MLYFKVFSGRKPFHEIGREPKVLLEKVTKGLKPTRPQGVQERHWKILEMCWEVDPQSRPIAEALESQFADEDSEGQEASGRVSPGQQPAPLQAPATPPANIPPPLPSARLNSAASSFVPGGQGRIRIVDASGHEVKFRRPPASATASPSPPPTTLDKSQSRRPPVRIESEDERKKRVAKIPRPARSFLVKAESGST